MVASFTMVLSGTIVNVAVPDVMGTFGVGQGLAQFLATAYLATMTASQLLGPWITGWLGRRLAFMTVLVVFAVGGIVCAASPSIDILILGRVMQGFSAGIVQPLVLTTILSVFPLERRGMATGIYISGLGLALGFGPVVGGLTIDALGWRYIFLVPLPFVAAALVLGAFFMPDEDGPAQRVRFDWTGYALLCVSLVCLMSGVANGQRIGWGCCFPLYLVRAPHELTGLFRRRISWDDGAIRDTSDRGEAAFLMTDGCRSDADAVARAALGPRSQAPA